MINNQTHINESLQTFNPFSSSDERNLSRIWKPLSGWCYGKWYFIRHPKLPLGFTTTTRSWVLVCFLSVSKGEERNWVFEDDLLEQIWADLLSTQPQRWLQQYLAWGEQRPKMLEQCSPPALPSHRLLWDHENFITGFPSLQMIQDAVVLCGSVV